MIGVHKLQDVTELRLSVQAACAEARLQAQSPNTVSCGGSRPASSVSSMMTDSILKTCAASNTEDTAVSVVVSSSDVSSIPMKPDSHVGGTSAGQLLAVLSSGSQGHTDMRVSATDSLSHCFIVADWPQQNLR